MPLIDKVEKSWTVYEENRPKTVQHNAPHRPQGHAPKQADDSAALATKADTKHGGDDLNARRSPEPPLRHPRWPQGHAPKLADDQVSLATKVDTKHGGAKLNASHPEPPLRHPRRPRGRAPPSRRRRVASADHHHSTAHSGRWNIQRRGPKRQATQKRRLARSARDLGFPPEKPGAEKREHHHDDAFKKDAAPLGRRRRRPWPTTRAGLSPGDVSQTPQTAHRGPTSPPAPHATTTAAPQATAAPRRPSPGAAAPASSRPAETQPEVQHGHLMPATRAGKPAAPMQPHRPRAAALASPRVELHTSAAPLALAPQ